MHTKHQVLTITVYFLAITSFFFSKQACSQQLLKPYGIKINVTDLDKALKFYVDVLNFKSDSSGLGKNSIYLHPATGSEVIILNQVPLLLPTGDNEAGPSFTLQVNDIDSTIATLKGKGVNFGTYVKRKEAVGYAIFVDDPSGTRISLMHQTIVKNQHFAEPRIYNYGFNVPDMDVARKFYVQQLGFKELSEKYLPLDLPLGNEDKSFAFMLHYRSGIEPIHYNTADNQHIVIVFQCDYFREVAPKLRMANIKTIKIEIKKAQTTEFLSFYDPFGGICQIREVH